MEKRLGIARTNFDYEFSLFSDKISHEFITKINSDLEFVALLWGSTEKLKNFQSYDDHYLSKLEKLKFSLPEFTISPHEYWFWGEMHNLPLERTLNSKETSFKFAKTQTNWTHPSERLIYPDDELAKLSLEGKWVLKPIDSVSSRGFLFSDTKSFWKQREDKTYWLAPWFDRVCDISFLLRPGVEEFLINTNDEKGRFRGVIVGDRKNIEIYLKKRYDFDLKVAVETSAAIWDHYQNLGAKHLQVDSFLYRDPVTNSIKYYPLSEVNYRKTLGELGVNLFQKFNYSGLAQMTFGNLGNDSGILLSPETSPFKLFFKSINDT